MDVKSMARLSRAPLLHVTVQESLKDYIEANALKAGDPLPPETFLAQQLGVGRNSMREAIKSLESLGILETRRGIGVFVKEFSFKPLLDNLAYGLQDSLRDVEELREIRRVLETGLIDKTIEMVSPDDLAKLRKVTAQMKKRAERNESFALEDQEFHQLLFRCQNNHMLSALIDIFWVAFNKASNFNNLDNPNPLDTWRDHHEIVEAVANKNVEQARRRLDDHYRGIQQVIASNRVDAAKPDA
ncbi:MAG TPA: FadR/GntR family transcriptional regulator [Devosia sp.]|nr:FadR/GntR family transcriptional regulator [Devosia sp.]